jgi:L-rhamnose mutarotase
MTNHVIAIYTPATTGHLLPIIISNCLILDAKKFRYMTRRLAFRMKLIPGNEEEYEKRHREIWPELVDLLRKNGVENYYIYLDKESSTLFAFQEITGDSGSQDLGNTEVVQRWWKYMADIMETHDNNEPVSIPLKEVFTLP